MTTDYQQNVWHWPPGMYEYAKVKREGRTRDMDVPGSDYCFAGTENFIHTITTTGSSVV